MYDIYHEYILYIGQCGIQRIPLHEPNSVPHGMFYKENHQDNERASTWIRSIGFSKVRVLVEKSSRVKSFCRAVAERNEFYLFLSSAFALLE